MHTKYTHKETGSLTTSKLFTISCEAFELHLMSSYLHTSLDNTIKSIKFHFALGEHVSRTNKHSNGANEVSEYSEGEQPKMLCRIQVSRWNNETPKKNVCHFVPHLKTR